MNDARTAGIFLRHGKVALPYASHDEMPFEVLSALGDQSMDPPADRTFLSEHAAYLTNILRVRHFDTVLCSPARRCVDLYDYLSSLSHGSLPPAVFLEDLRELRFDLNALFRKEVATGTQENIQLGSVGERLYATLLSGEEGVEPLNSVTARVRALLARLSVSGKYLCISQGYLMRLIAVSLGTGPSEQPWRLAELVKTPRISYLGGFESAEAGSVHYFSPASPLTESIDSSF